MILVYLLAFGVYGGHREHARTVGYFRGCYFHLAVYKQLAVVLQRIEAGIGVEYGGITAGESALHAGIAR